MKYWLNDNFIKRNKTFEQHGLSSKHNSSWMNCTFTSRCSLIKMHCEWSKEKTNSKPELKHKASLPLQQTINDKNHQISQHLTINWYNLSQSQLIGIDYTYWSVLIHIEWHILKLSPTIDAADKYHPAVAAALAAGCEVSPRRSQRQHGNQATIVVPRSAWCTMEAQEGMRFFGGSEPQELHLA